MTKNKEIEILEAFLGKDGEFKVLKTNLTQRTWRVIAKMTNNKVARHAHSSDCDYLILKPTLHEEQLTK